MWLLEVSLNFDKLVEKEELCQTKNVEKLKPTIGSNGNLMLRKKGTDTVKNLKLLLIYLKSRYQKFLLPILLYFYIYKIHK